MRKLLHYLPKTEPMIIRLCMVILIFCCQSAIAEMQPLPSTTQKDDQVKQIVLGIMSYTRWVPPPSPVQLCIVGTTRFTTSLEHLDTNTTPNKIIVNKQSDSNPTLSAQCDVIYFGDVKPEEQQKIIATRQNHPILVLSESNPSCELGSSFCLDTETFPITFVVNLDSLARSGVHVNPNVLLLGKKRAVQ